MNVLHVVGARPNFMKVAPVFPALGMYEGVHQRIARIVTGSSVPTRYAVSLQT
jgi:UDP-N-acetylglucosamine 2-epimerase